MESISAPFEKELDQLRQRLAEAEEVRRAITGGEVDAFFVAPGGNSRVLLLANAYQRYRQLVEKMRQGAVTATINGNILFANQRFSDMLDVPLAQLYAAPLDSYVSLGDRQGVSALLMRKSAGPSIDVELNRRDGSTLPVRLSLASLADGYPTLLITDLRPMQWPALALEALDSIRNSVEELNQGLAMSTGTRHALQNISEEINGLARIIDEMLDVESVGGRAKSSRQGSSG
jgi:PAS domain S-box-containing protein